MAQQPGIHGGKAVVQRILDRNLRQVRATVVPDVKRETLQNILLKNVKYGTKVYTDVPWDTKAECSALHP
jgi:hypothetical protein